ncbi:MAG TPA: zinc-ribbon domain-containing protein, partial [Myxococcota bacterium]
MIVTCPGCGSKYRVRDEAVPQGGAELKCPSCGAVFVAHPPKHSEEEIGAAVDRITKAKDVAELRLKDVEREKAELERRAHEAEARTQQLEAQIIVLR